MVGHCRDTLRLLTAGTLGGWAVQGYSAVDTLGGWGTAGMLGGGHCRDALRLGTAVRVRAEGEDNMDFKV